MEFFYFESNFITLIIWTLFFVFWNIQLHNWISWGDKNSNSYIHFFNFFKLKLQASNILTLKVIQSNNFLMKVKKNYQLNNLKKEVIKNEFGFKTKEIDFNYC